MTHSFYRDDNGEPRAETGRRQRLLGRFLEADVQGSRAICDEAMAALADVDSGRVKRWRMTGNAHTVTAGRRRARIHAEHSRAVDLVLPTSELRRALLEWRILLGRLPSRRR